MFIQNINVFSAQSRNQGKMVISLDLEIWAVLSISEVAELFSVKFKLTTSWIDPRLTFLNLKEDTSMNIVAPAEAAKIWYPVVVFINTRKMDLSKVKSSPVSRNELQLYVQKFHHLA